eukprot:6208663-Pleurochrysis_carterae.AAC.2
MLWSRYAPQVGVGRETLRRWASAGRTTRRSALRCGAAWSGAQRSQRWRRAAASGGGRIE